MKATLKNYRQSPRKVRLVADLVSGKSVDRALSELKFTPKRASLMLSKLIESAVSNAKDKDKVEKESLFVKNIQVNAGKTLQRSLPMSRGRAFRIHKRSSHITISLEEKSKIPAYAKASAGKQKSNPSERTRVRADVKNQKKTLNPKT